MNIFEILSKGKGSINEENISSFLGYLLNPVENHDLDSEFFERFLKWIGISDSEIKITNTDSIKINLEYPVQSNSGTRYIDLLFETANHIVAIENKIAEKSIRAGQVQEEYEGLRQSELYKNSNKPILFIFLVPEENKGEELKTYDERDTYKVLWWKHIIEILIKILKEENLAEINPINDYVKQTIKAFINFMNDAIHPMYFNYDNQNYRIYKYSSGQILVEQEENNCWVYAKPSAKAIIRGKLKELKPDLYNDSTMQNGTTRSLGAKLYKEFL